MVRRIPIFFASDDNYLPYLAVAIRSIADNGTDGNVYDIKILTNGFSREGEQILRSMELPRVEIEIVNVNEAVTAHRGHLKKRLRDYYSESIYYRIFIGSLYPELERAIYLDCDIVLVDDVAKLYDEDMGDAIIAAVADESIPDVPAFCKYVDKWVGVPVERYINSGVLLMNLVEFRRAGIERRITSLVSSHNFDTVAPDQDYLNFLCSGRIRYLPLSWNKQPKPANVIPVEELHLIHYNMFNKPWHYGDVPYSEVFWHYAERTPFIEGIRAGLAAYGEADRARDLSGAEMLVDNAARLAEAEGGFADTLAVGV